MRIQVSFAILLAGIGAADPALALARPHAKPRHNQAPPLKLSALFDPSYRPWIRRHPDQFNWMVFVLIAKHAPETLQASVPVVDGSPGRTNNAVWETWPDDEYTFPATNMSQRPVWPQRPVTKQLHTDAFLVGQPLQVRRDVILSTHPELAGEPDPLLMPPDNPRDEEVRRNFASFQTITRRGIYTQAGLAKWNRSHHGTMHFLPGSIEVKAKWDLVPLNETDFAFHDNYNENGKRYKLVALHVITNALPEWTWATWEWVGNAGRCDNIGCHDDFGPEPAARDVEPASTMARLYPPEPLSRQALALQHRARLSAEWSGYRLKGSQVVVNERLQTLSRAALGNTRIESTILASHTSSCIACHAQAVADVTGKESCTQGFVPPGRSAAHMDYPASNLPSGSRATSFVWAFLKAADLNGVRACTPPTAVSLPSPPTGTPH